MEGSHPCSYGQCIDQELNHAEHNDTMYDDGHHLSVGDRNKDYGCWFNDPLDQSLVNCTIDFDGNNHHRIRIRWDAIAGEELFVEYGKEFWQDHYWSNPDKVKKRYPDILPTYPGCNLSVDLLKNPKTFEQAKTRP